MKKQRFFVFLGICIMMCLFGTKAFAETDGIYTYEVSNGRATIKSCNSSASGDIIIPSELGGFPVTSIGKSAFQRCRKLTSIVIPDSVTFIGDYAFYYCESLTSINIPDSVTSIGDYAFSDCDSLTSINIPNSVTFIGADAFSSCESLISINIPNGVTSIGDYAFCNCMNLSNINIPDSVVYIGSRILNSTAYYENEENWYNNALYLDNCILDTKSIITGEYIIKDNTRVIASLAFHYRISLTSINIPNSVTSIGAGAFSYCESLISINIPNSVTSIGDAVFSDCESLTSINIPNSVTSIGDSAFSFCWRLTSITIPDSVTSIGDSAFSSCWRLTSINIPNGVISIGEKTFYQCERLTSITIPDSVTSIGDHAFCGCDSLTSINIPNSVTSIGDEAFSSCEGLTSVVISDGVTSIGVGAFYGCDSLTSINIPDSVTSIREKTFEDCYKLTSINIPDSVTFIGADAFYYCYSLTSINIPDSVIYIGASAFAYCTNLSNIYNASNVRKIGESAFQRTAITSISLPKCEYIGESAFNACSNLSNVELSKNIQSILDSAFEGCTNLKSIKTGKKCEYSGDIPQTYFEGSGEPTDVKIYSPKTIASPGDVFALEKSITPEDADNYITYWKSSDRYVASVDCGIVTCLKQGTTVITATTTSGKTDSITIIVDDSSLSINGSSFLITPDKTITVTAKLESMNYTGADAVWSIGDLSVAELVSASFTDNGNNSYTLYADIKGIKGGETDLTVKAGELSAKAAVTVSDTHLKLIPKNEDGKDFVACKMKKENKCVYIDAEFKSYKYTWQDVKWSISNPGGNAEVNAVWYEPDFTITDSNKGTIHITVKGTKRGYVNLIGKTPDGVSTSCKIMVQEPLEITSSTPKNNKTNVSLWCGALLAYTPKEHSEESIRIDKFIKVKFNKDVETDGNQHAQLKNYLTGETVADDAFFGAEDGGLELSFSDPAKGERGLEPNTKYYITIPEKAVNSTDDEYFFEGITDKHTFCFTTEELGLTYHQDEFSFGNNPESFFDELEETDAAGKHKLIPERYYIDDYDLQQKLYERCGENKKRLEAVVDMFKREWGGTCFSMAAIVGLVHNNMLSASDIYRSADCLYDVPIPATVTAPETGRHRIRDVLNYYQLASLTYDYKKITGSTEKQKTFKAALNSIAERAKQIKNSGDFIINFKAKGSTPKINEISHSVLAHRYRENDDCMEIELYDPNTTADISTNMLILRLNKENGEYTSCHFLNSMRAEEYNRELYEISYSEPSEMNELKKDIEDTSITFVYADDSESFTVVFGTKEFSYDGTSFDGDTDIIKEQSIVNIGDKEYMCMGLENPSAESAAAEYAMDSANVGGNIRVMSLSGEFDGSIQHSNSFISASGEGVTGIELNIGAQTAAVNGNNMKYKAYAAFENDNYDFMSLSGSDCNNVVLTANGSDTEISSDNLKITDMSVFDKLDESKKSIDPDADKVVIDKDGTIIAGAADVSYDIKTNTVEINSDNDIVGAAVIFAAYRDGRLVSAKTVNADLTAGKNVITTNEFSTRGADLVKVMVWKSADSVRPLFKPCSVAL